MERIGNTPKNLKKQNTVSNNRQIIKMENYSEQQSAGNFSDFFESMFGGAANAGRNRQVKYRGEDYNAEIHLNLIDAYTTHKQTITINGKNIRITIPAGIENGQSIRIVEHGGHGVNGGPDGDLFITFLIPDQEKLKRLENNLYTSVDLDLFKAVLGGEITIDTLTGKVKLKVKPETKWKYYKIKRERISGL